MVFLASLKENDGDMAYQLEMASRRDKRSELLKKIQFIRNVKKQEAENQRRKEAAEEKKKKAHDDIRSPP